MYEYKYFDDNGLSRIKKNLNQIRYFLLTYAVLENFSTSQR